MNCSARFRSLQTLKTSSKMLFWLHVWWYLQHLNNLFLHVVYACWLPIKKILKLSRNSFMNIIKASQKHSNWQLEFLMNRGMVTMEIHSISSCSFIHLWSITSSSFSSHSFFEAHKSWRKSFPRRVAGVKNPSGSKTVAMDLSTSPFEEHSVG